MRIGLLSQTRQSHASLRGFDVVWSEFCTQSYQIFIFELLKHTACQQKIFVRAGFT